MAILIWKSIPITHTELNLCKVLRCGQTFRWKNINHMWSFSINDRIILLKQDDSKLYYSQIMKTNLKGSHEETYSYINDYFYLDLNLSEFYTHWKVQHLKYKSKEVTPFDLFKGIRILQQDPWECLISFICSSNNNVKRISKMCENLCVNFGTYINTFENEKFYSFPTPEQLSAPNTEGLLRDLGFGYRAKYIYQTALKFTTSEYPDINLRELNRMKTESYDTAHAFLLQLSGVGPKVADCICLMSLQKHNVVPIDTHVYQIAIRDYKYNGKTLKSMNKETYNKIRLLFQGIFGDFAGWAQSVLFASDLNDLNNGKNITIENDKKRIKIENDDDNKRVKIEADIDKSNLSNPIKVEV
ncbi:unnamed protein product [Candida verbasci]|uniref:N-glycosylase/DNA lyase n=1 Tax=Candida verbasci TaxID=1227364 RepID=A0A9W4TXQ9_9ASCO|nr:unnamed protein product [Candida verbasci]